MLVEKRVLSCKVPSTSMTGQRPALSNPDSPDDVNMCWQLMDAIMQNTLKKVPFEEDLSNYPPPPSPKTKT